MNISKTSKFDFAHKAMRKYLCRKRSNLPRKDRHTWEYSRSLLATLELPKTIIIKLVHELGFFSHE